MLEKTLGNPLDSKEVPPVHLKGNQAAHVNEFSAFQSLRRRAMTNLDRILRSRDITLPTKVHLVRLWFFKWSRVDVRVGP